MIASKKWFFIEIKTIFYLKRQIVEQLIDEYKAAENPNYIDYGFEEAKMEEGM